MQLPTTADIVIIGGGVMGASAAYHLAQRGAGRIVLLEKEPFFGQGSTGRCAGGVRYQFFTEINVRLSMLSLPMLERFEEEIGQAVDYRQCGYLFMLTTPQQVAAFQAARAMQNALGVATEWLDGDEIRRRLPLMAIDDVLGGTFHQKDGLADPNGVVMGYVGAAQKMGVQALTDIDVAHIINDGSRVSGVRTDRGDISAPVVVNAAGAWAGPLSATAGVLLPIEPITRQVLTTTPLPAIPHDFPMVVDSATGLYMHREGGGLLIGLSNQETLPGYSQRVDEEWQLVQMETAAERLPLLEQAGLAAGWAGLYEVTPDHHPIFGATPLEGLYVVAGFSGHGFMHGTGAGLLLSEIILDGAAHTVDVSMLDLARFGAGRLIHEHNVI